MRSTWRLEWAAALLVLAAGPVAADEIAWHESLGSAEKAARKSGRPVMADFWSPGCGPCDELVEITFADQAVRRLAGRFEAVRVNAFEQPELAAAYTISFYPTVVFMDADGTAVHDVQGFVAPEVFVEVMREALAAHAALIRARAAAAEASGVTDAQTALAIARDFSRARQHLLAAEWAKTALEAVQSGGETVRAEALLIRGSALLEVGEPVRAAQALTEYLTEVESPKRYWLARLKLGYAWLQQGREEVGVELLRVVAGSPDAAAAERAEARRLLRWVGAETH